MSFDTCHTCTYGLVGKNSLLSHRKAVCSLVIRVRHFSQCSSLDWEPQGKRQDLALMLPLGELLPTVNTVHISKHLLPAHGLA